MSESTRTSKQRNVSTCSTIQACREKDGLVAIPYSATAECEPPVPMVPLKSPERSSRDCSREPRPMIPPSCASSIYAESAIPTILEMPQSVEEHACPLPSSMLEPMSASIYEVTWEDVFPVEEVMDEVTGLPIYIAPWIIRSESDEDDNRRVAEWTPPAVPASLRRQPTDNQAAKKSSHKWKQGRDVEPLVRQPKKKRNFWMSFRKSKKAIAAAVTGSSQALASPESNETAQRGPSCAPKRQSSACELARKDTVVEKRESSAVSAVSAVTAVTAVTAVSAVASSAGEPDPAESRPKPALVVSAAEEVKHPVVSVTQVDVPTPPTTPKNEEPGSDTSRRGMIMGHRITMAIPEGKLLNDELRARFCC